MKIALYLVEEFEEKIGNIIKNALDNFKVDKVIIVPSMKNCDSKEQFDHKVFQIFFYLRENDLMDKIKISTIELKLIPPYHKYATLHALKNNYCNDKVFILCEESDLEKISDWMNGGVILNDYDFLIV